MKLSTLIVILLFSINSQSEALDTLPLNFTDHSEALFDKGEVQSELVEQPIKIQLWDGSFFESTWKFQKSIVNENLYCLKFLKPDFKEVEPLWRQAPLLLPRSLQCTVIIDTQKR